MKWLRSLKDKLITGVQWLIKALEFVVGLVVHLRTALKYLRQLLDILKSA